MRALFLAGLAGTVLACASDSVSSNGDTTSGTGSDIAVLDAFGVGPWLGGVGSDGIGGYGHLGWRLNELPDSLALTSEQQSRITALIDDFKAKHQADLDSLESLRDKAETAGAAGASRDSVHAILAAGDEIRDRLRPSEEALTEQIEAVLTAAQRAYLADRTCGGCDSTVAPLSDEQKATIDSLVAAFEEANAADIAAAKTGDETALDRLRSARDALQQQILAVLTPEQVASGCYLQRGAPDDHHGPGGGHHDHGPGGSDGPDSTGFRP